MISNWLVVTWHQPWGCPPCLYFQRCKHEMTQVKLVIACVTKLVLSTQGIFKVGHSLFFILITVTGLFHCPSNNSLNYPYYFYSSTQNFGKYLFRFDFMYFFCLYWHLEIHFFISPSKKRISHNFYARKFIF